MTTATAIVTDQQRQQYQDEGYFILEGVIDADMIQMLREECSYFLGYQDASMDSRGIESEGINHKKSRYFIANRYRQSDRLWKFIFSPLMAEVTQTALGDDVYLFHEQWVVKGPEQGMKFAWHQDSGYVGYPHRTYLTCWCTLDDVDESNGTVYILPYSRAGSKEMQEHRIVDEKAGDKVGYFGDDPGIPVEAPAGSIVAFSSTVFHRSGANTSDHMRRIYLPQYSAEPIVHPEGHLHAWGVPFVKGGELVYDHAADVRGEYPDLRQPLKA